MGRTFVAESIETKICDLQLPAGRSDIFELESTLI